MQRSDNEGKGMYTKADLLKSIRTALGGRAAEIVYYGNDDGISTGASGDIYTATKTAEQMICTYGMDDAVGLAYIESGNRSNEVFGRVNEILKEELANAVSIISENKNGIDALTDALLQSNHLKEGEIDNILSKTVVPEIK